ncbi:glycosyltransferase family 4 protein [Mucilaginibacter sp. CSA2-8R]|uniref:glycosyltransferase family 4 protein n=1 Tax=Mucilaginibacter sp. CSA2-8R TaxID=3141542 RepID=UPI00315CF392
MIAKTPNRKVAYYCLNDPLDKRSWSGVTFYLGQALQRNVGEVDFLGPVEIPWLLDKAIRALQKLSRLMFKAEWIPKYSLLKNLYAMQVLKRKMKGQKYDFLMAPAAAPELAYLKTNVPIVYFGDATYKIYSETYHQEFKNVSRFSKWEGDHLEKKALDKSALTIFTSHWAAGSAMADYGVPADKTEVILFGANMDDAPLRDVIYKKYANGTLTLLFLAVDWERKGGSIAFDTLKSLREQGLDAKLIICGCVPPAGYDHPDMQVIPFINKNDPEQYELFVATLSSCHFLILPTRAECSLIVANEANSYGVPAITTIVGGVPDVVIDGVNGYCLPLKAGGYEFAGLIKEIFTDHMRYAKLVETSRNRFEAALNWDKWAEQFQTALQKHDI